MKNTGSLAVVHPNDGIGIYVRTIEILTDNASYFRSESPTSNRTLDPLILSRYGQILHMMRRVRAITQEEIVVLERCLSNYGQLPPEVITLVRLIFEAEGEPTSEDERHVAWTRIAKDRRQLYESMTVDVDVTVLASFFFTAQINAA